MLPNQASPSSSFKYRNSLNRTLKSSKDREKIVLLSSRQMKRYPIFQDKEIGIAEGYRNTIKYIVIMMLDRERMRITIVLKRLWTTASSSVSTSSSPMKMSQAQVSVYRSKRSSIPSQQSRQSTPGQAPSPLATKASQL